MRWLISLDRSISSESIGIFIIKRLLTWRVSDLHSRDSRDSRLTLREISVLSRK